MDLLRISTAGSVDDGKSTLIGRLLYDSKALTKEQESLIIQKTKEKGLDDLDFSVITDGLVAEREQGITIDVAHIYFSSEKRKFIIADSPGHVEYTRNMVTGASNSQVSIILIDARKGLLEQSYRHFFISQLLRVHDVIFCVNKMDLVSYQQDVYEDIKSQIHQMINRYKGYQPAIKIVPVSSLKGDNIVKKNHHMDWFKGNTLSELLHSVSPPSADVKVLRFEVQQVLHVQNETFKDYRGYSGRISSGSIQLGDQITILPSNKTAKITEIRQYKDTLQESHSGESVTVSIDRDMDISRGSIIVKSNQLPQETRTIKAKLVWLNESTCRPSDKYIIQSGTRTSKAKINNLLHLIPPEHPEERQNVTQISLNDICLVEIGLAQPIYLDAYHENKNNGAFILVDPNTFNTCAVGFVE